MAQGGQTPGAGAAPAGGKGGAAGPMAGAGKYGGMDPYQQAATAQGNALGATQGAMGAMAGQGFGQYGANRQQGPGNIARGIDRYMNPYTDQVINRTSNDMRRSADIMQDQIGAQATQAGAFGGSRHGVAEGTMMGDTNRAIGDIAAQQRAQGFNTAAGLSGQDIANRMSVRGQNQQAINQARQFNSGQDMAKAQGIMSGASQLAGLGQQSYGYGRDLTQQQMAQGQIGQDMAQQLLGQGAGMFDRYVNQPQDLLKLRLGSLGVNPLNNTGSQTSTSQYNPGMMDYLGLAAGTAGAGK